MTAERASHIIKQGIAKKVYSDRQWYRLQRASNDKLMHMLCMHSTQEYVKICFEASFAKKILFLYQSPLLRDLICLLLARWV